MKKLIYLSGSACFIFIAVFILSNPMQAQTRPAANEKLPAYEVSSNEEAHVQLVKDFIEAVMKVDKNKVKKLVSENYMDYGPSAKDSFNIVQVFDNWTEIGKQRTNQDAGVFVATALKVNEGSLKGEWVNVWGNYTAKVNESGYKLEVPWHRVFFIQDNKIVLSRVWYDQLSPSLDQGKVVPAK